MDTPIATLTYKSLQDLQGRHPFQGKYESEMCSFTLQSGIFIEGKFLEPKPTEPEAIFGDGTWNPPDDVGGPVDDGQFGSGTVGQPQGNYDGIALPSVGFGGK